MHSKTPVTLIVGELRRSALSRMAIISQMWKKKSRYPLKPLACR